MPAPGASELLITLDTDWAPDCAIDLAADILREQGARATWFITHDSPAIRRLAEHEPFEIGVHPNFLAGSSHGEDIESVLRTCLALAPDAVSFRMHCLYQWTRLLWQILETTPLRIDSSAWLPMMAFERPGVLRMRDRGIVRFPISWTDDLEMEMADPEWSIGHVVPRRGKHVLNFHPIHIYLNCFDTDAYERVRARIPAYRDATDAELAPFRAAGVGAETIFRQVAAHAAEHGSRQLREAAVQELGAEVLR